MDRVVVRGIDKTEMGEQRRQGSVNKSGIISKVHAALPLQGLHAMPMCTAQTFAVRAVCLVTCTHTSPSLRALDGRQWCRRCRGAEALQGKRGE